MEQQQEARQRFQMLLQQLELTEDVYMSFFEEGELARLTVHKKIDSGILILNYVAYFHFRYINYFVHI